MKVLYILGRGRGGSTVLANVLGEIEGFFSAGELRYLWDPVVVRHSPCGCGEAIDACPIWSRVLDELSDIDLDQVVAWQHEIVRESNTVRLVRHNRWRKWPALENYARVTSRLYKTVADITGARVIVDSSKRPSYAAFVRVLEGCNPYFVHLVRDPRASAYSWHTRKYESAHGNEVRRRSALDSTLRWDLLNAGSETLLRRVAKDHYMRLRYEDFVQSPLNKVRELVALADELGVKLPFVDAHTVTLSMNHTIAGNPSRFRTGVTALEDRKEWTVKQDPVSRWVATAVALPLLRRYGYGIRAVR